MAKDLFVLDTACHLNRTLTKAFERKGYGIHVEKGFDGVPDSVLAKADGYKALCLFVNKKLSEEQVEIISKNGTKLILCCSAGYDNVPIRACQQHGIRVARVPSYSPSSIAEYAVSSIMALAKNLQMSYEQTKRADFTIGGLQCILMEDKTAGFLGTGLIGKKCVEKLSGLVQEVLCYDTFPSEDWIKSVPNAKYVDLETLLTKSNFISIHVPLLRDTYHLINKETIAKMKKHVIIVNTSRGEVVNTEDLVEALKSKAIFGCALDVFEEEKAVMFQDKSGIGLSKFPLLQELAQMHNVIISSHIAFYTDQSLKQITEKTVSNFEGFEGKTEMDDKAFVA